jgi:hypothetical protein
MSAERPCDHCGAQFVPRSARHRYCSDHCRYVAKDRRGGHVEAGTTMHAVCCDCAQPFRYMLIKKYRKRCVPCAEALAHRERPEW